MQRTANSTDRQYHQEDFININTNPRIKRNKLVNWWRNENKSGVLKDDEVKAINQSGGVKDLPRRKELLGEDK